MHRLTNPVRTYAWGSRTAIPELLGVPPDGKPQAEIWIGAHPDSPSVLPDGTRLDAAIRADPVSLLGEAAVAAFGKRLPFLVKVLAAAAPLSLQVHPDAAQAAAGFAAEQSGQVPVDAPHRRYHDPYHKPEMVVPLTPFQALCGLRPVSGTRELLSSLDVDHAAWPQLLGLLAAGDDGAALRASLRWLLSGDLRVPSLVDAVATAAAQRRDEAALATAAHLARAFPGDPGVIVALLLNRVSLSPGQALYLPAGNIHAYLEGTAVEVMASSDNVLRAGLTSKHVDADELLQTLDFVPRPIPFVVVEADGELTQYRPGAAEFELVRADLGADGWRAVELGGPRILLVLEGEVEASLGREPGRDGEPTLHRGEAAFLSAADAPLSLRGSGVAVVVGVPAASLPPPGRPRRVSAGVTT